jgi:hypothetical protein
MSNKWKTVWALLNPRLKAEYSTDFEGAVAVVAAPFNCYKKGESTDLSNGGIAFAASKIMSSLSLPFIGQFENTSLVEKYGTGMKVYEYNDSPTGNGEHITTYEMSYYISRIVTSINHCNGSNSRKVILVGHPHHVRRVAILLRYFDLEVVVSSLSDQVPYDPQHKSPARHSWTLSVWRYTPWEYASRVHHALMIALGLW